MAAIREGRAVAARSAGFRTFVVGLCMGAAEAVPGVSGGTIALIAGVYERLIAAVTSLTPGHARRLFAALRPPVDRGRLEHVLREIDAAFLLPLGFGIVAAVVLLLRAVSYADEHHPVALFGLIAASVVVLSRAVVVSERRHLVAAVAGFGLAFAASGDVTILSAHGPAMIFVAGTLAISGLVLPGVPGSLILVVLGQYPHLSETPSTFTDRLAVAVTGEPTNGLVEPGATLATFVLGDLVGLFTVERAVDRALDRDRETTLAFLVSLVVGVLRAPVAEIGSRPDVGWTRTAMGTFAIAAVFGAALLIAIDRYAIDVDVLEGTGAES